MKKLTQPLFGFSFGFIFVLSLTLTIWLPVSKVKTVWDGYQIIALPPETEISDVIEKLKAINVLFPISKLGVNERFSGLSYSGASSLPFTTMESYNKWFFNEEDSLQYIYLPIFRNKQAKIRSILNNTSHAFFMEDVQTFSVLQMMFLLLFLILCIVFSERKTLFFLLTLPLFLYASLSKGALILIGTTLLMYSIMFWLKAIGSQLQVTPDHLKRRIKNNPVLIFAPIIAMVIITFQGMYSLMLCCIALLASVSSALLFLVAQNIYLDEKNEKMLHTKIKPYAMNPSSVNIFWEKTHLLAVSGCAISIFLFGSIIIGFTSSKQIHLGRDTFKVPQPVTQMSSGLSTNSFENFVKIKSNTTLPDLASFIQDQWYMRDIMYSDVRNVQRAIHTGDLIHYDDFIVDSTGRLTKQDNIKFTFNDVFLKTIFNDIPEFSIEKMLLTQGRFVSAEYRSTAYSKHVNIIALVFFVFVASVFPLYVIIMRLLND